MKMLRLSGIAAKATYCPKEVAQIFGTPVDSVYRLLRNKELKRFRIVSSGKNKAGKYRIDFAALVDFIATEPDEE